MTGGRVTILANVPSPGPAMHFHNPLLAGRRARTAIARVVAWRRGRRRVKYAGRPQDFLQIWVVIGPTIQTTNQPTRLRNVVSLLTCWAGG